ncbi:carbohydrate kinase family protein [Dorea sp. OM02-2LB]|nr:carbohydrate kinase family protein [Dorea sp. OM02-2LB]RGV96909.1 carbohydrate kinase family protein [Ruminococcus sp. AF14-10]
MGIVVIGDVFIDIKGYSIASYIPQGRNVGTIAQIHGGVGRNVVEDIANLELKPTFVGLVDDDAMGEEVIRKLNRHKVDTRYMKKLPNGMGTWLAIFDNNGDVVASVSKRPDHDPVQYILEEKGDEIFKAADSIAIEIDTAREIVKKTFALAEKYQKKVYAMVSNMSIAVERRDFLRKTECFVCNEQEAGILFSEDYSETTPEQMAELLAERVKTARIPKMIVTMGEQGAVYADQEGNYGVRPPMKVDVVDTTGAGDAFFAGVCAGLTYGKNLEEACAIGTRLSSAVICTSENICPRFMPEEFGLILK